MFECEYCGKAYRSKTGLRRHVKAKHPKGEEPAAEVATQLEMIAAVHQALDDKEAALAEALEVLGISEADVMSYRVYEDRVVIIEGPAGYQRVWLRE